MLVATVDIVKKEGPGTLLSGLGPTVVGYGIEGAMKVRYGRCERDFHFVTLWCVYGMMILIIFGYFQNLWVVWCI